MKTRRWAERRPSPPRAPAPRGRSRPGSWCSGRAGAGPVSGRSAPRARETRGPGGEPVASLTKQAHDTAPRGRTRSRCEFFYRLTHAQVKRRELPAARMSTPRGPAEGAPSCPSHVQGQSRAAEAHAPPRPEQRPLPGPPGAECTRSGLRGGAAPCSSPRAPSAPRRAPLLRPGATPPGQGTMPGLFNPFHKIFFGLLFHSHVVAPSSSSDVSPTEKSDNPVS